MITIFDSRAEDFSTLGLCVVQPTECDIEGSENGMMELTMTCPMDAEGRWQNLKCYNIVRAPSPVRETPLIRVTDNPGASEKTVTRTICKVKTYTGKRLRLRAKPSTSAKTLGYYAPGTEVVRLSVSGDWAQVVVVKGGASGWMSNERLQVARTETEIVTVRGKDSTSKVIEPRQTREQLFRICEVKTDDEASMVYVVAKHIFYDLAANTVKGDYSPEGAAVGEVCAQMLARALNPHDFTLYCTAEGTVTGDYGRKGIANCLLEDEIGVASQTGAKIILDNFDIFVLKDEVRDNGVEIRHAKNLRGAELTENVEDVITRVVPVGKDKNGDPLPLPNGEYVETPRAASIPVIRSKEIEYDVRVGDGEGEYKTKEKAYAKLRELAAAEFSDNGVDGVTVGLDVDFVALENTTRYQDYAPLQYIHMGDTVRVVSPRSGIDAKLRMTGFTYDAAFPGGGRYKTVKLGQINELRTQVYGFDIARGTMPGTKILPGSVDAQAALRNATIGYAKIAQAAIEQLAADSIVAIRADIHEIVAGSVTTDQLYADIATLAAAQITAANIEKANIDWAAITTLRAEIATIAQAQITTAIIKSADIDWAQIDTLTAKMAEIAQAKIDNAEITSAQIKDLEAVVATLFAAKIGSADIGFAQIKDLVAGTAIITEGVGGELYIARLAVTEANMVSLTVGELIVKGEDGGFYALGVDADGNIRTTVKQIANSDVENLSINAGEKLIEGSVTAACLNAKDIFADSAIIRQMIAANIDVGTLFAREAFIAHLNTSDISGNEYLKLTVKDAVDGVQIGGRNYLVDSRGPKQTAVGDGTTQLTTWIGFASSAEARQELYDGKTMVALSFDWENHITDGNVNLIFNTTWQGIMGFDASTPATGHFSKTFVLSEATGIGSTAFIYAQGTYSGYIVFRNIKLEKGDRSTDWSPAPEDAEGEIDGLKDRMSSAELKITDSAIVSTVTQSTEYKALTTRMTTAESKIEQKADSVTLSVLETKVDGIQVGGRNYLVDSKGPMTVSGRVTASQTVYIGKTASIEARQELYDGETTVTISFDWENHITDGYANMIFNTTWQAINSFDASTPATGHYSYTFVLNSASVSSVNTVYVTGTYTGDLIIRNLKLEKGNKSTDWSPAPEDPAQGLVIGSSVEITKDRVRILSQETSIAIPSADSEDGEEIASFDENGLTAQEATFGTVHSDSVVATQARATLTPANAGELQAILDNLSCHFLTGTVTIDCSSVQGGTFTLRGLSGGYPLNLNDLTANSLTVARCTARIYLYRPTFSTSGTALTVSDAKVYIGDGTINAATGVYVGEWGTVNLANCGGTTTTLLNVGYGSTAHVSGTEVGVSVPYGLKTGAGDAYSSVAFKAAQSPVETPTVTTAELGATSTKTWCGSWKSGNGLYQGRYISSDSTYRRGCMWFNLSAITGKEIVSASLKIKRYSGVGGGGSVTVNLYGTTAASASGTPGVGTRYASVAIANGQTKTVDVTAAVKALAAGTIKGLMIYDSQSGTFSGGKYTYGYCRIYGSDAADKPVLSVTYK